VTSDEKKRLTGLHVVDDALFDAQAVLNQAVALHNFAVDVSSRIQDGHAPFAWKEKAKIPRWKPTRPEFQLVRHDESGAKQVWWRLVDANSQADRPDAIGDPGNYMKQHASAAARSHALAMQRDLDTLNDLLRQGQHMLNHGINGMSKGSPAAQVMSTLFSEPSNPARLIYKALNHEKRYSYLEWRRQAPTGFKKTMAIKGVYVEEDVREKTELARTADIFLHDLLSAIDVVNISMFGLRKGLREMSMKVGLEESLFALRVALSKHADAGRLVKIQVTPKVKDVRQGTVLAYDFDFGVQLDKSLINGGVVNGWQSMVTSLENTGKAFQLIQAEMPELKERYQRTLATLGTLDSGRVAGMVVQSGGDKSDATRIDTILKGSISLIENDGKQAIDATVAVLNTTTLTVKNAFKPRERHSAVDDVMSGLC